MLRLSGLSPEDIEIRYTGIRPGEKLYEELRFEDEKLLPTAHPKVQVAYHRPYEDGSPSRLIKELRVVVHSKELLLRKIRELVPEYQGAVVEPAEPTEPAEPAFVTPDDPVPTVKS
jgi:FlaA1/EpsC-like NDP-sugar epimerase